jgi:hypothetical protein
MSRMGRVAVWTAISAATVAVVVVAVGIAGAATAATTPPSSAAASSGAIAMTVTTTAPPSSGAPAVTHGSGQTLLTGATAATVRAAALAAVPGATIVRVETGSGGSPYEAHLRKADGASVTVEVNAKFVVTSVRSGSCAGTGPQYGTTPPASNGSFSPQTPSA